MRSADPQEKETGVDAHELLDAAKRRVLEEIRTSYPSLAPGGPGRAEGYLEMLTEKIREVIEGADAEATGRWLSSGPLYAPLLDALGRKLIEVALERGAGDGALVAVRACWALGGPDKHRGSGDPKEDPEDLRTRMKGPDAFGLLREVAHDFRSPLTSILFLAEALRDGNAGPVTELQRSQLGLIYSAAFGLASVASDIMDLAKEERDLISGEPEAFSLGEVFQSVERMVLPLVEEKRLELRVVVPDRWQGRGHPHALKRVLLNLTTNALKFTDEGWVELGVRPRPHGRLEYYVEDTGRGMTEEQRRRLFQPFKRRSQKAEDGEHFSGSGIGLSIARRLLHAMGAELSVESSDEKGTRFWFELRQG